MASILCVDDEVNVLGAYRNLFARRKHEVRCCPSLAEAMRLVEAELPDLVITELKLHDDDGRTLIRELRKRSDTFLTPVVVVSRNGSEDRICECLAMGATDYLVKPISPAELLAKVRMALEKADEALSDHRGLMPGCRFVGRFEIQRQIGAGGFASVFHAWDWLLEQEIALKVFDLPPARRATGHFVALFLREAYELSKLSHPNVVKFLDFGQHGNFYYMCMDYLVGENLEDLILHKGVLPESALALVGYEVACGIEYLNQQQLVHRDIKPSNIMVTESDVKLLDFGLAKHPGDMTLSPGDEFRATPHFAAPEYIDGQRGVDHRSDLFSLGATLYYASTMVFPFDGDNLLQIYTAHFHNRPEPVHLINTDISPVFGKLISRLILPDPDERPSVAEVQEVLGAFVVHA